MQFSGDIMRRITDLQQDLQGTKECWFIFCNQSPKELLAQKSNIFRQIAPCENGVRVIAVVPDCFAQDFDQYLRKDVEIAITPFDYGNAISFAFSCAVQQDLDCALFAQANAAIREITNSYSVLDNQFCNFSQGKELFDVYTYLRGQLNNCCKIASVYAGKEELCAPLSFYVCDLQGLADNSAFPPKIADKDTQALKWLLQLVSKGIAAKSFADFALVQAFTPCDLAWARAGFRQSELPKELEQELHFVASCTGKVW